MMTGIAVCEIPAQLKEIKFYHEDYQALEQIAQRGCVISTLMCYKYSCCEGKFMSMSYDL